MVVKGRIWRSSGEKEERKKRSKKKRSTKKRRLSQASLDGPERAEPVDQCSISQSQRIDLDASLASSNGEKKKRATRERERKKASIVES